LTNENDLNTTGDSKMEILTPTNKIMKSLTKNFIVADDAIEEAYPLDESEIIKSDVLFASSAYGVIDKRSNTESNSFETLPESGTEAPKKGALNISIPKVSEHKDLAMSLSETIFLNEGLDKLTNTDSAALVEVPKSKALKKLKKIFKVKNGTIEEALDKGFIKLYTNGMVDVEHGKEEAIKMGIHPKYSTAYNRFEVERFKVA